MTAQINDSVVLEGTRYSLVGIEGDRLFEPAQVGLKTEMMSTACYRGFYCTYAIRASQLVLAELTFRVAHLKELALKSGREKVFGRSPKTKEGPFGGLCIDDLSEPIHFSGGLLLGADFIQDLYVHMGFQAPYNYRNVWELLLEDGVVLEMHDRSEKIAEYRQTIGSGGAEDAPSMTDGEAQEWIKRTFSRKYRGLGF